MTLAEYLEREGLNQIDFARLHGFPQASVSTWLSGDRRPSLDSAFAIEAATTGAVPVSTWRLADDEHDPPAPEAPHPETR